MLGVWWFERWFAGEEGGAAVVGRQPLSSPLGFGRGLGRRLQSKRGCWFRRETRECQMSTLSLSKIGFVC